MNVRELKDNSGVVFSPKVSTESVYLKGSTTNLESKLGSMDTTISGKANTSSLAAVATSGSYTDLSNKPDFIPNSGTSINLGDGTSCTIPSAIDSYSVLSWAKSSGSRDTNIFLSSQDGTFIANSGDCGYIFAVYNTDITTTGNFADVSEPVFKVNDDSGGGYCVARYGFQAPGFYVSSSRKVKENIEPTKVSGEDMINSVNVVDFNYIDDETHAPKVGFIAEDTDPLFSTRERKSMDSANCIGILMKAVQELSSKVKNLTSELDKLTSKVGGGRFKFELRFKHEFNKLTLLVGKTSSSLSFNYNRLALPMNYRRVA